MAQKMTGALVFDERTDRYDIPFVDIIAVNKIVGFNNGTVILKNVCIADAPSIFAASYTEYSMFCNPERKNTILYPVHLHKRANMITIFAANGCVKKLYGLSKIPKFTRT